MSYYETSPVPPTSTDSSPPFLRPDVVGFSSRTGRPNSGTSVGKHEREGKENPQPLLPPRPPLQRLYPLLQPENALISFGNMMCYSQCLRAIHQTQLNPVISFLHTPGERRFSLSLDLAEIFKPILVDRVIFKVLNKKIIGAGDFDNTLNRIVLKPAGKKAFVKAFEDRLSETIQHRSLKRSVSYKHLVKLECYKLVKHVLGIEEYQPFKMWW